MEAKTKKTLLTVTIIVLLVINISALTTIFYNNNIKNKRLAEEQQLKTEMQIRGMHRFISDELKLTDEQFDQFEEVNQKNMLISREIVSKLNKKRRELVEEVAKINPSNKNLDAIAKDIGQLHYELKKATTNHFLDLKELCNEDQQENLNRLFFRMVYDQDFEKPRRGIRERGKDRNRDSQRRHNNR